MKERGRDFEDLNYADCTAHIHTYTLPTTIQVDLYKSIVKFCRSHDDLDSDLSRWEVRLSQLLEAHPELADGGESEDEEDSQGLDQLELSDAPSSLPSEGLL